MPRVYSKEQLEKRRAYAREYGRTHTEQLREGRRKSTRVYSANLKRLVIEKFSKGTMRCVICGEDRIYCLSIDHIHGGGSQHRKELKIKNNPRSYYKWLIENGSLGDYQALCMNCQFAKRYELKENN